MGRIGQIPVFLAATVLASGLALYPLAPPRSGAAQIVSDQSVPRSLGPHGGLVVIEADVRNALGCTLKVLGHRGVDVVWSHAPSYGCESGYYSARVEVGANPSRVRRTITFRLVAYNATSRAVAVVPVQMAGDR